MAIGVGATHLTPERMVGWGRTAHLTLARMIVLHDSGGQTIAIVPEHASRDDSDRAGLRT